MQAFGSTERKLNKSATVAQPLPEQNVPKLCLGVKQTNSWPELF